MAIKEKEVDEIIKSTSKHNQILKLSIKYLENKISLEDFNRKLVNLDQSIDNMAIKEIARQLDIAETTVKIHVQHILRKLNLTSRVQVAVFAVNNGLDQTT